MIRDLMSKQSKKLRRARRMSETPGCLMSELVCSDYTEASLLEEIPKYTINAGRLEDTIIGQAIRQDFIAVLNSEHKMHVARIQSVFAWLGLFHKMVFHG